MLAVMKRLLAPLLILSAVMLAGVANAQDEDPYPINRKGFARNGISEQCWYIQIYEQTNPHFMPDNLKHTTDHELRTITFDDPECMADTLDGLDIYLDINKMMINNLITGWLSGTYFVDDIQFATRGWDLLPPGDFQSRGECIRSTNYPSMDIYIEYFHDGDSITGFTYMAGLGTGCE